MNSKLSCRLAVVVVVTWFQFVAQSAEPKAAREEKRAAGQIDLSPILKADLEKHPHTPGLVAVIVDGERITAIGSAGVRKAGSPELFTEHDLIHLGSCTK